MPHPQTHDPPMRADAVRNREAILATARELYGQRGLRTPLDEIARQAGIGNATLYRHFPTRCALVAAVFADTLSQVIVAADAALDDPDPWHGFAGYVRYLCQMQATDRGLADLLTTRTTGAPGLEKLRTRAYDTLVCIAQRAMDDGSLRADFEPQDLGLLLMANAGLVHRTCEAAPGAWRRFVDFALDGFRATAGSPASPPPSRAAMRRAMTRHGHELGYD
jgi:AcrR family transcriptional regulator